jgi:hypothetical protein
MKVPCVVRVGTSNNFNCTDREFAQLDGFTEKYPDHRFFVNSNAKTPRLSAVADHPYKAVVTVNPDLAPDSRLTERSLALGRTGSVSFFRVKWLPHRTDIEQLLDKALAMSPVVVTMQRFNSRATMERFAVDKACYALECARFRLHGAALKYLHGFVNTRKARGLPLFICDRKGLGCLGCGLCATLNGAKGAEIKSLNLSASGVCPYSCPDCYAKQMQKFVVACGNKAIRYNTIMKNKKQSGNTKHIQNVRREAA